MRGTIRVSSIVRGARKHDTFRICSFRCAVWSNSSLFFRLRLHTEPLNILQETPYNKFRKVCWDRAWESAKTKLILMYLSSSAKTDFRTVEKITFPTLAVYPIHAAQANATILCWKTISKGTQQRHFE